MQVHDFKQVTTANEHHRSFGKRYARYSLALFILSSIGVAAELSVQRQPDYTPNPAAEALLDLAAGSAGAGALGAIACYSIIGAARVSDQRMQHKINVDLINMEHDNPEFTNYLAEFDAGQVYRRLALGSPTSGSES